MKEIYTVPTAEVPNIFGPEVAIGVTRVLQTWDGGFDSRVVHAHMATLWFTALLWKQVLAIGVCKYEYLKLQFCESNQLNYKAC